MAKINVDGKTYEVDAKQNLLHACLSVGLDVPYFCYHPALGSVGACRQCAVKMFKNREDTKGKIIISCMQPVEDGMIISINDEEVRKFRAQVIEALMNNHPHDCPVCDEGGECHLQDMTVMTGHNYRKNRFPKRTYHNQHLGPFIHHEMNRCIQCYRCVRFYKEYAGGNDFDAFGIHDHVYFGKQKDGVLENEFSGNLVEVCPTGVFTDKSLKQHYTRKWDLTTAPSVCTHCSLGCNTIPGERYGTIRRIRSRYNHDINGYFLCDRGRYGYEYVNHPDRIKQPASRQSLDDDFHLQTKEKVINELKENLSNQQLIGIGSPRASLESNFALKKLVGEKYFYAGFSHQEHKLMDVVLDIVNNKKIRIPALNEIKDADFVLVLGEDVTQTAPMLALSLRQTRMTMAKKMAEKVKILDWQDHAVRELYQEQKAPIVSLTPRQTKLDEVCIEKFYASPDEIAQIGYQVAHQLNDSSPAGNNLPEKWGNIVSLLTEALKSAEKPLIVTGTGISNINLLLAAANIAQSVQIPGKNTNLFIALKESNSMGLAMLGGKKLTDLVAQENSDKHLLILENDLYRRFDEEETNKLLKNFASVTLLDYLKTGTSKKAHTLLSAGTFAETSGTFVNNEGRAQRFYKVYIPKEEIQDAWRWLKEIQPASSVTRIEWNNLDECVETLISDYPIFEDVKEIAPPAGFRVNGQKIPREPHRLSGRTAMHADVNVHEQKTPEDDDSPLSFSMEGTGKIPHAALHSYSWAPGWNSIQAINKYQIEVGGSMHQGGNGKRLIQPEKNREASFYNDPPQKIILNDDELHIVPGYHIFGSEQLSIFSSSVAERVPTSYVMMHPEECQKRNIKTGDVVKLSVKTKNYELPLKVEKNMAEKIAVIPVGLPGLQLKAIPSVGKVTKK